MNIIFTGSKGKTGSIVFNYLKEKGYTINDEVNLNSAPLKQIIKPSSIVIDFTTSETALKHAKVCLKNNSHFICGTTGIKEEEISKILNDAKRKNLDFIFSPNFSIGINELLPFLSFFKKHYPKTSIIESHHISKKDLPSGTSLLLKKHLHNNTNIDSIRTTYPSLKHTILLESDDEEITITHIAKSKLAYAKGVEMHLKNILEKRAND